MTRCDVASFPVAENRKPEILDTVCLNVIYSGIQAGAQMTLLPLMLVMLPGSPPPPLPFLCGSLDRIWACW